MHLTFFLIIWGLSFVNCSGNGINVRIEAGYFSVNPEFGEGDLRVYRYNRTHNNFSGKFRISVALQNCMFYSGLYTKNGNRFNERPIAEHNGTVNDIILSDKYVIPQILPQTNCRDSCIFKPNQTIEMYSMNVDTSSLIHMCPQHLWDQVMRVESSIEYQNKTVISGYYEFVFDATEYYRSKTRRRG